MEQMEIDIMMACTTFSSKEKAHNCCKRLVESKLVVCAQICGPIDSIYSWDGKISEELEWRVVMKTSVSKIYKLKEEVMRTHEYETPQWVSWKVTASSEYGSWVESAT